MKLTCSVAAVAALLVAGTTTICLSGALGPHVSEYASAQALLSHFVTASPKAFR